MSAPDGAMSTSDAGSQRDSAQVLVDAASDAAREAGSTGGGSDAGTDAGGTGGSRFAQICGSASSFPSPLPADENQRRAQPVGSQTFGFIEGPVWLADQGVLLFSDMDFSTSSNPNGPSARIRRLRPPSSFDVFAENANSNGLALGTDGAVLGASHDIQGLSRFDAQSAQRTLFQVRSDAKRLNSPNDLTVRSDGTVFFTDPDWQLGPRSSETKLMGVYKLAPPLMAGATHAASLLEGTLNKPNGVALSPDESTLYVGSSGQEIWKYPLAADGSVGARSMFVGNAGASDGMAMDCAGNLYVAAGTIKVFAPSGMMLGQISLNDSPSNAAFGGADRKTLYITAGSRLYSIQLNVPGFPY
jgi:gluconolactonase